MRAVHRAGLEAQSAAPSEAQKENAEMMNLIFEVVVIGLLAWIWSIVRESMDDLPYYCEKSHQHRLYMRRSKISALRATNTLTDWSD